MWIALGWVLVLLLLAGWSALVWTGSALLTALLAHAGTLGAGDWSLPEPLAGILPTWAAEWLAATLENWTPQLQSLGGLLPSLSGGVTVLAWGVWLVGAVMLLVAGLAVHVAIALCRKAMPSNTPARPAAS